MTNKVLIAEDDKNIRDYLVEVFKDAGYQTEATGDGAEAINIIKKGNLDVVILDLGLESINGESVCIESKKLFPKLPVIMLTARGASKDVVHGLNIGADDYIAKPFDTDELMARVKVRLNRKDDTLLKIDDLVLNTQTKEVKRGDKTIKLTAKEFKLLEYLMSNAGIVLSRENILDHIWLYSPDIETRVVDVYIGYLRKKVDGSASRKLISSVRGFGYKIQ